MLRTLSKRQKGGGTEPSAPPLSSKPPPDPSRNVDKPPDFPRQIEPVRRAPEPPRSYQNTRSSVITQPSEPVRRAPDPPSAFRKAQTIRPAEPTRSSEVARQTPNDSLPPDFGRIVWITDPEDGFRAAQIIDLSKSGFTLTLLNSKETVTRKYEEVFSSEDDPFKSVEDNCALMHLNAATLLNNCRLRYKNGKIYSYVANILISINPYQTIDGFYSTQKIKEYRGKSLGQKEPHIYAIADKSYREMRRHRKPQSIIVSGESGAGKTESQKSVLRYLCENWGAEAGPIQQRLLETNPVLEAFGNAKTLRNNNSSRFGKFVQIHFGEKGNVAGGYVSHYLLETSRICRQASGERNYHIFYQLIAGTPPELYTYLALGQPHCFNYLKNCFVGFFTHPNSTSATKIPKSRWSDSRFSQDSMVDDFLDFQRLENALMLSGLKEREIMFIWTTIAGVLHLGNIEFEENIGDSKGGCRVSGGSEGAVEQAARLLGLETMELKMGLCARIMQTKGGARGTLIRVPLKSQEAYAGRDALSKAIYTKLFDWLVSRINQSIPFEKSTHFIGVLDVAGFEYYAVNSFEQFCINFCNEKLQNFFNERILKEEQALYEKEGLNVRRIEFVDNQDCIELFEMKSTGLFDLLDEEARLPTPSFKNFTKRAHEKNRQHFRLDTPRKSKVKSHREMRDDEGLLIRHYAGSVCYETKHFVEKNDDQLHNSLQILIEQSTSSLLVSLFPSSTSSDSIKSGNKLKSQSVGSKFKSQLSVLLKKLDSTGTHFVRCIKPNNQMTPWQFDGSAILSQLQCAGMTSVLKLMQDGFPSRTSFGDLYPSYQRNLPPKLARLDSRLFAKCLFRALGLDQHDFQFGLTKVFFRAGKFAEFDQMMRQDPEHMMSLINKVNDWLVKSRWRQAQYAVWSVIKLKNKIAYRNAQVTKLQSMTRGYLARQRYSRQIAIYRKSCNLLRNSKEIEKILSHLNENSRAKWTSSAHLTIKDLEKLVSHVRLASVDQIEKAEIAYEHYVKRVDSMILDLRRQQKSDEVEELERKRRQEEENERVMIEEKERLKRMEEQKARIQKEHETQLVEQIKKAAKEKEENEKSAQQEKLDAIVPNRLADSDGIALVMSPESGSSSGNSTLKGKYDLAHWKYAELRDAINHSMDINLLVACEEEFRRRLRIYNEWKSRNASKRDEPAPARAQLSVYDSSGSTRQYQQRYFKYIFDAGAQLDFSFSGKTGMWYAHFSGEHIHRQITIRPSQMPQLMIAGRDDLQMCELTLRETGLEHKPGAKITEEEFENQWKMAGGN